MKSRIDNAMKRDNFDTPFIKGLHLRIVVRLIYFHVSVIALFSCSGRARKAFATVRRIKEKIRKYLGPPSIQKVAHVNGRYFWDLYTEGWPSPGFTRTVRRECRKINSSDTEHVGMRTVLFGITTRCPLQCEHCFEWNNLNIKERLSFPDLQIIIEKLISYGIGQIFFGGGEPMMRYDEILRLLELYSDKAGFWMVTSGFNVTEKRAYELKHAGLTGMCVSLDHYDESLHNRFRHHRHAYAMAKGAVAASNKAGLVAALSLCATKEFTNFENLSAYAKLARSWGVSFIQLLEPKPVGHYEGKMVTLPPSQKKVLEDFFLQTNNNPSYKSYPLILYHEYYRATLGCRSAGNGSFYIDPLGQVHACPFCRGSAGNLVNGAIEDCVSKLLQSGCPVSPALFVNNNKSGPVKEAVCQSGRART